MSGHQFQQHSTPQQQPPRFHNNNKSGAPNQNNNNGQATGSSSTTPNAASGISFEYSEPPGATTRTTPDSGLGTDDQKQANQSQNAPPHRVPPGFIPNRGHPHNNYYQQGMHQPQPQGMVYYNVPQPQGHVPLQGGYEQQYGPPAGYNQHGQRVVRYSENSGYAAPEDSTGANNNFVIHGPNETFDGRPQYNQQAGAPQQQPQMMPVNYDGHQNYGAPPPQGQVPQAQFYAGQAVIHPNQQHGYQNPQHPQFRGAPPQQMIPIMQGSHAQTQQTSVVYSQHQVLYPSMYAPVPVAVVTRSPPMSSPEKGKVTKRNSHSEEETAPSPPQMRPNTQPPQQEFVRNPMVYPQMVGYQNMTPQQAQMQQHMQQMNAYGMNHVMMHQQQQQQQQQLQMNAAAVAAYQGYAQIQPHQGRPGQVEPLMGAAPGFPMGVPGRGGFQQRGGHMHPHNSPMQPMGFFQAPTNGPPSHSNRGGRGRGRGNFHSRQNSGQSHYSGNYNQRGGQFEGNRETPSHDEVESLSTEIEQLETVSTKSATASTTEQEVSEAVESKPEETEPEEHTNTVEETSEEADEPVRAETPATEQVEDEKSASAEDLTETHCYHCEYHEKSQEEISSHNIRRKNGELWCKELQKQKCQHCEATGENGHHYLVCPKKKEEEKAEKEAEKKSRESSQSRSLPPATSQEELVEEDREETPEPQSKSRHNSESFRSSGRYQGNHQYGGGFRGGRGGRGVRGGGYGGPRGGRGHNEFSEQETLNCPGVTLVRR